MASQFWIKTQTDKVVGPVSTKKLRELAEQGQLKEDHRISADQQKWVAARSVNGLTFQHGLSDSNNHRASEAVVAGEDELMPIGADLPPLDDGQNDDFLFPATDPLNEDTDAFPAAAELPLESEAPQTGSLWDAIPEQTQPDLEAQAAQPSPSWGQSITPGGQIAQTPASMKPTKPRPPLGVVITAVSLGLLPVLVFIVFLAFNFKKLNYAFVGEEVVKARQAYDQIKEGMSMSEVDEIVMAIPVEGEMQRRAKAGFGSQFQNEDITGTDVEFIFRLKNQHEECSIAVKFKKYNKFEKQRLTYKGKEGF